jgi:hypothetical protein
MSRTKMLRLELVSNPSAPARSMTRRLRRGCLVPRLRVSSPDLEASHQIAQLVGHFCQMLGRGLRLAHTGRRALRRFRYSLDVLRNRRPPPRRFRHIPRHLAGGRALFLDRRRNFVEIWLILSITPLIPPIAVTAPPVFSRMTLIFCLISSVAFAVCLASSLTSLATTANPFPASPARAASMVAFSASRLVCCAIDVMTSITLADLDARIAELRYGLVGRFGGFDRLAATRAASVAFLAISPMVEVISSAPEASVCRLVLTCPPASETTFACAVVSSELAVICWLVATSSSLAAATCSAQEAADSGSLLFNRRFYLGRHVFLGHDLVDPLRDLPELANRVVRHQCHGREDDQKAAKTHA